MKLRSYLVNAFTEGNAKGNPAVVVPLQEWLKDGVMQAMARENNVPETAFFVPRTDDSKIIDLRWFTPEAEIELCGHATLASAHMLFNELGSADKSIHFHGRFKGDLHVTRDEDMLVLNFPRIDFKYEKPGGDVLKALGVEGKTIECYKADRNWYVVLDNPDDVASMKPKFNVLQRYKARVCVTAPGTGYDCDFVSRFFLPDMGISEDPVTGSTHCALTPYWARHTGKTKMTARQLSARGGVLHVSLPQPYPNRVFIGGKAQREWMREARVSP